MSNYDSSAIEVLSGLEPVRKRPGMYTDTTRPNHLAQEVLDNSVDEAIAGHAKLIEVTLFKDQSLQVRDDGRGMPVDIHPEEGIPGVEVILTKLHAGGKFSNKNYPRDRSSSRHSRKRCCTPCRLEEVGDVGKRNTGTTVRFWPDPVFFDSPKFSVRQLEHVLRAKAVLCPGLRVVFKDEKSGDRTEWHYEDGLRDYLLDELKGSPIVPEEPFIGSMAGNDEAADWAVVWLTEGGEAVNESYVNLIPTSQGGTHVNGLRTGLTDAVREFCEFRNLLPRGVKLTPDDVWNNVSYILSVKLADPQFSGQTKERLSSRECAPFVSGVVKDSFSLWLNQHTEEGEKIADLAISSAQSRMRAGRKVQRKKVTQGPALPGKLADCTSTDPTMTELFLVEGDSAGGSAKQARDKDFQAIMPLRGKILNTWEVDPVDIMASQEVHDISVALGVDPGSDDLSKLRFGKICILADADSDGLHIATLLCALFVRHFPKLVREGHVYVAMPPLYRIDVGKQVFYALDEGEKQGVLDRIAAEKIRGKVTIQRFKGLGEMNPKQLRETTIHPDTRRLVQLTIDAGDNTHGVMDMLLAKKRASDRKSWLQEKGDMAEV
ncbi:MAG: DNA topoisomerase IV subunit B [Gammaproteobacteria bacterium]